MTRPLACLLLTAALVTLAGAERPTHAAAEFTTELPTSLEVVVIEARGCPMCQLFRDEIAPIYRATARATRAPLRFVDVAHADLDTMGLMSPVEIIPTVVLMRDGAEVDRLVGYTGPDIFMRAIGIMLGETPRSVPQK
ncbi:MAG TPA: thioredoxin family protein [Hyphomicrobiaceae bacterium]|nr:thioredoxin family protein [Hyphomicrobiaceae bacterium]